VPDTYPDYSSGHAGTNYWDSCYVHALAWGKINKLTVLLPLQFTLYPITSFLSRSAAVFTYPTPMDELPINPNDFEKKSQVI